MSIASLRNARYGGYLKIHLGKGREGITDTSKKSEVDAAPTTEIHGVVLTAVDLPGHLHNSTLDNSLTHSCHFTTWKHVPVDSTSIPNPGGATTDADGKFACAPNIRPYHSFDTCPVLMDKLKEETPVRETEGICDEETYKTPLAS